MSLMDTFKIASSGLAVSRLRLNLAASNMANARTTRGVDGQPFRRKDVVVRAVPIAHERFIDALNAAAAPEAQQGVEAVKIVADPSPPRKVYQPSHPHADGAGYVAFPNINPVEEMVNMMTASRAYEASLSTLKTASEMAERALSIGR